MLSRSEKYVTSSVSATSPEKSALHPHGVPHRDVAALYARSFYPGSGTPYHHHHSHRHHLDQQVLKSIRDRYYEAPHLSNHSAALYHARSTADKRSPVDLHYMYGTAPPPEILRNSSHRALPGVPLPPSPIKSSPTKIHHNSNSKLEASQLLLKVSEPSSRPQQKALLHQQHSTPTAENSNSRHFPAGSYPHPPPAAALPLQIKPGRGRTSRDSTTTTKTNNANKTPTKYLITADGEQRPQCPECFQTFKKRAALERHMMIHRGIKPFQCHFCNQRFRQKHHLQGHIMLHTGERPHACTLCNKRFRMRHHLLEHERISHKVFR